MTTAAATQPTESKKQKQNDTKKQSTTKIKQEPTSDLPLNNNSSSHSECVKTMPKKSAKSKTSKTETTAVVENKTEIKAEIQAIEQGKFFKNKI